MPGALNTSVGQVTLSGVTTAPLCPGLSGLDSQVTSPIPQEWHLPEDPAARHRALLPHKPH